MLEMRAQIHGRVQAVGFRATTQTLAQQFGLIGFVRNCPDGSVEIVAQGKKEILETFINKLKQVFDATFDIAYTESKRQFDSFTISF